MAFWGLFKDEMRNIIITYSKEKAKRRRNEIEKLESEINNLESQLLNSPLKSILNEIEGKRALFT